MRCWQTYGANNFNESNTGIAHNGTNCLKVYQSFGGAVNYSGIYQDYISGPHATVYAVDGWAHCAANDVLTGQNVAWLEVSFRDAKGNILALYRSALINTNTLSNGSFPKDKWNNLAVTNQYDPGSFQVTILTSHN